MAVQYFVIELIEALLNDRELALMEQEDELFGNNIDAIRQCAVASVY